MKATVKRSKPVSPGDVQIKTQPRKRRSINRSINEKNFFLSGIIVKCTDISKVYWPGEGNTKGDLVDYYFRAWKFIHPYLKDRPLTPNLHPDGIRGKNIKLEDIDPDILPDWIHTENSGQKTGHIICNDPATLIYMAQMGCIEINPSHNDVFKPENPTYMVLDLDPGNISFVDVVNTALVIKELCDESDIQCLCKTNGTKGLQIYFPLGGMYEYVQVYGFAQMLAEITHKRLPSTTSIERMVARRRDKVYIDFSLNDQGQTMIAPYSAQAKPGAPVSAPLEWNEVDHRLSPEKFNIRTMINRLEEKGDLWKPVLSKGGSFAKALPVLEKLA